MTDESQAARFADVVRCYFDVLEEAPLLDAAELNLRLSRALLELCLAGLELSYVEADDEPVGDRDRDRPVVLSHRAAERLGVDFY